MKRVGSLAVVLVVLLAAAPALGTGGPPLSYARHWTRELAERRCRARGPCHKVEVTECLHYRSAAECVALIEFEAGYCTFTTRTRSIDGVLRRYTTKMRCVPPNA